MTENQTPVCKSCGRQLNKLHKLSCFYAKTHYDMVKIEQCIPLEELKSKPE